MKNKHIILLIALAALGLGLYLIANTLTPMGYETTKGHITGEVYKSQGRRNAYYEKTVTFKTRTGETITAADSTFVNAPRFSNEVEIAYDPANPQRIKVLTDTFPQRFGGGVTALIGVFLIYLARKNR